MPSVAVDDMWHELVLHTRDYAAFCETAFGRFLHHTPESAMSAEAAAVNRAAGLAMTFRLAQQDEDCPVDQLPLLFGVDRQLGIGGGAGYLTDCGGRDQCHDLPGSICLKHLGGPRRARRGHWDHRRSGRGVLIGPIGGGGSPVGGGGGCGGSGCGGGGCGGGN